MVRRIKVAGAAGAPGGGTIALSDHAMRNNFAILEYSRTFQSAVAGCAAGIIGLTSLYGFVFYFVVALAQSFMWFLKAGARWDEFFVQRSAMMHGFFGGLFTYVLFWTFLYGMVHVY